jgi:hypothetical protein
MAQRDTGAPMSRPTIAFTSSFFTPSIACNILGFIEDVL